MRARLLGVLLVACLASAAPAVAQPYVYVANGGSNNVSQYDATAGGLTPLTPATVLAGQMPSEVAVSPDGKSVYVTNNGDGTVSQFDVGADGALTPKVPATVTAGAQPKFIAISPDAKSV
jgi:YVTN family beta-propeller protein